MAEDAKHLDDYYDQQDPILLGFMLWVGLALGIAFWGGIWALFYYRLWETGLLWLFG